MTCLIGCLAIGAPRLALALVFLFSNYLGRAYDGWVIPVVGFLFLPTTTLAYAWAQNSYGSLAGAQLLVVIVAFMLDVGLIGGGGAQARRHGRDD